MANINENFEVQTGLQVGNTTIVAATGDITGGGNLTVGSTTITSGGSVMTVGGTVINGTTGAITTTGNITTTAGSITIGNTVITGGSSNFADAVITGGSINNTPVGASTASTGRFTTLATTGVTTVGADILPSTNNTINIGSATNRFGAMYVNEAFLSTNTLYLGTTPILGTTDNVINIHADPGQAISMQTTGAAGQMTFVSNAQMTHQTIGNNADVLIQSNGTGSKTRLLSGTTLELTAPTTTVVSNVTVTGSSTVNGNMIVAGNLTVTGTTTAVNTTDLNIADNIIVVNSGETGLGVTAGTAGIQFARGQLQSYQLVYRESDDTLQFGPIGSTATVATVNGSGAFVGNITGSASYATTAGTAATVTTAAQPTITSVGTLSSLAVTGAVSTGDLTVGGNLVVSGSTTAINATTLDVADLNVTVAKNAGSAAAANGAGLTVAGANATMTYASADDSWNLNKKLSATSFYGSGAGLTSIPNAALTNNSITVTAGTGLTGGGTVALGGTITLNATSTGGVTQLTGGGGITVSASTGAITLGSTATSAAGASTIVARDVSGNFSAGTITANLTGTASNSTQCGGYIPSQAAGTLARIVVADASGWINNTYFSSTDNAGAGGTPGTNSGVTSIMVKAGDHFHRSGSAGAVSAFLGLTSSATTANDTANTANTLVKRDASGNFSAGLITATATSARYADLAENYAADAEIEPGTVVCFGGSAEVTTCNVDSCARIAGVVSTAPAYLMNNELAGVKAAVALQGRVPVKVVGEVRKGDMLVSAGNGAARAEANPRIGTVIGKALEDFTGAEGVIEVVVGRV